MRRAYLPSLNPDGDPLPSLALCNVCRGIGPPWRLRGAPAHRFPHGLVSNLTASLFSSSTDPANGVSRQDPSTGSSDGVTKKVDAVWQGTGISAIHRHVGRRRICAGTHP